MSKPALFRMPLVCLGTHSAPQRDVRVTPERARHWVAKFNEIKAAGNRVPIPWGHQLDAVPYGDAEARRYAMARWNAGHVERLEFNPATGWVNAVGTVPPGYEVETGADGRPTGRLVNPTDHTAISEMSAGIGNWRDGKGTVHRDIIIHAALCTLPVVAGQPGVTAALATEWDARDPAAIYSATLDADGVEYLYTLGTATMADPDKKPAEPDGDEPVALDEGLPEVPEPAPEPTPVPAVSPDKQAVTDVLAYAAAVNLPLPADTTPQNLLERLKVALATVAALGWKLQAPPPANGGQPDGQIQTGVDGAQPEPMGTTAFMSTEPGETVTLSADAAEVVEAYGQEKREAIGRHWTKAEKAGHVRKDVADRERGRLAGYKLAVDPVTKRVTVPEAVERLELALAGGADRAAAVDRLTTAAAPEPAATLGTEPAAVPDENPARTPPPNPADKPVDRDLLKFMAGEAGLALLAN